VLAHWNNNPQGAQVAALCRSLYPLYKNHSWVLQRTRYRYNESVWVIIMPFMVCKLESRQILGSCSWDVPHKVQTHILLQSHTPLNCHTIFKPINSSWHQNQTHKSKFIQAHTDIKRLLQIMSDYGVNIGIKADTGIMLLKSSTVSAVVNVVGSWFQSVIDLGKNEYSHQRTCIQSFSPTEIGIL
jgi:hypothetical protein